MVGNLKSIVRLFVAVGLCALLAACGAPDPGSTVGAPTVVPSPTAAPPVELEPTVEPTLAPVDPTVEPVPTVEPPADVSASPAETSAAPGAVSGPVQPVGGACPDDAPIKGNADSKIYHVPGGSSYSRTKPEQCFRTAADAEAQGYRAAKR